MCVLFAYGVACLLFYRGRKGTWQGILTAVSFWFALAAVSLAATGVARVSPDLLRIEVAYTFVASVVVGAIIGGVSRKLAERT
jgi:uncharacterized membrane protein YjjP (DUF1212 family)